MPSLYDLFSTQKLKNSGKTAKEEYEIRNSKDMPISTANSILNSTTFPIVQKTLRSSKVLTNRTKETFLEQELVGVKAIATLASPVIYGTDIIRINKKSTNLVNYMKNVANGGNETDNGIIGNAINKVQDKALSVASTLGISFPENLIPTKVSLNKKFIVGLEPDTMTTLAEIKNDAKGTILGKFLAKNAKGTPKQIGRQLIGAGIDAIKAEVRKKLFGSPLVGGQNLAKKSLDEVQYDRISKYSNTILPTSEDISVRNDLSSIYAEKQKKLEKIKLGGDTAQKLQAGLNTNLTNLSKNPLPTLTSSSIGKTIDKIKSEGIKNREGLSIGRKEGQRELSKPENTGDNFQYKTEIPYSGTVDETADDVLLRNDLSTKLDLLNKAIDIFSVAGPVSRNMKKYSTDKNLQSNSLVKRGMGEKSNFINSKSPYVGTSLTLSDGTKLDDKDFITVKFTSVMGNKSVNFLAVIDGVNETISPSWESAKFIGSPFNYYTYSGIERSVSFNMKIFSLSPEEHVVAWDKIDFLTSLTYPIGYDTQSTYITPPFLKFTMGDLYKNKECFIESLSYTFEDNGGWETGNLIVGNSNISVNGVNTDLKNYKLPRIITAAIALKFVESRNNTSGKKYGFGKPAVQATPITDATTTNQLNELRGNAKKIIDTPITNNRIGSNFMNSINQTSISNRFSQGSILNGLNNK